MSCVTNLYLIIRYQFSRFRLSSVSASLSCRHVMNELLETERAYVEELLCVLQVFVSTMGNFLVFYSCCGFFFFFACFIYFCCDYRVMPLRWRIQPCLTSSQRLCRTKRRFCLVTCQRFTIFTNGK